MSIFSLAFRAEYKRVTGIELEKPEEFLDDGSKSFKEAYAAFVANPDEERNSLIRSFVESVQGGKKLFSASAALAKNLIDLSKKGFNLARLVVLLDDNVTENPSVGEIERLCDKTGISKDSRDFQIEIVKQVKEFEEQEKARLEAARKRTPPPMRAAPMPRPKPSVKAPPTAPIPPVAPEVPLQPASITKKDPKFQGAADESEQAAYERRVGEALERTKPVRMEKFPLTGWQVPKIEDDETRLDIPAVDATAGNNSPSPPSDSPPPDNKTPALPPAIEKALKTGRLSAGPPVKIRRAEDNGEDVYSNSPDDETRELPAVDATKGKPDYYETGSQIKGEASQELPGEAEQREVIRRIMEGEIEPPKNFTGRYPPKGSKNETPGDGSGPGGVGGGL